MSLPSPSSGHPRMALLRLAPGLVALGAALGLSGCAVLSPPPPRVGGDRLSEAAKETRKEPTRQSTLQAGERVGEGAEVSVGIAVGTSDFGAARSRAWQDPQGDGDKTPDRSPFAGWHLGAVAGGGSLASADFAPSALYGLSLGGRPTSRATVDVTLLGGPARFTPGSDMAALLRSPWELAAEVSARWSLTPEHAARGVAPLAGFRFGTLSWRYRNGIRLERDGELKQVSGDRINHYSPYLGAAFTLVRTPRWELGAAALTGWRFHDPYTYQGLRNDLFGGARFTELRIESRISF